MTEGTITTELFHAGDPVPRSWFERLDNVASLWAADNIRKGAR
jgi:hypothetical protein